MKIQKYETKHDFCKITQVHDNKNYASSIRPLKNKLFTYENNEIS